MSPAGLEPYHPDTYDPYSNLEYELLRMGIKNPVARPYSRAKVED